MGVWDIRQYLFKKSIDSLDSKIKKAIPFGELPAEFKVNKIIPRTKDGGAFVNFSFLSTDAAKGQVAENAVQKIQELAKEKHIMSSFKQIKAFLVKGEPFLEDILARYPTPRLRIEFQGDPVSIESLYHQMRSYGKIFDISIYPNPNVSKDPARYAIVQFTRVRFATSARNCLHGYKIDNTRLNILYERQMRTNVVKEWLVSHPRITVPVVAAIFAGITYIVFDPIRTFFVISKITHRFNVEEYGLYRWLRKKTWNHLIPDDEFQSSPEGSAWANDFEQTEKLKTRLAESTDCEKIANARNQSEITKSLAKQVGYFPIFTWVSSMSGLIDTVVSTTTGQKANFSSTSDSKMKEILETVAIALHEIMPNDKETELMNKEEQRTILKKMIDLIQGNEQEPENKAEKKEEKTDYQNIPVVVIDNYMCRETSKNSILWEELAEWASILIENSIAHVVFVSSNASVMKSLGRALPGRTFSTITLSDAPPEKAMSFIKKQLGEEIDGSHFPEIISAIGGRLTELEVFVQKMKMNMDAKTAFEDIIIRNLIEIRKYGFGYSSDDNTKIDWTPIQFWTVIKLLAEKKSINYEELKWSEIFAGNDYSLSAMERAELITVTHKEGRPNSIRPGKPIYYTVFKRLVSDIVFASSLEVETNMYLKKQLEEKMAKLENTIEKLSNINQPSRLPQEIEARICYLLTNVESTQKKIEEADMKIKSAKENVSNGWVDVEN